MPLDAKFIKAEITGVSANAWKLSIHYNYYGLYTYTDVFVYDTQQKAKDRLILERCQNKIKIIDNTGNNITLEPGAG